MKRRGTRQRDLQATPECSGLELAPPTGLEAHTFVIDGDEYVLFGYPLTDTQPPTGLTAAEQDVVRHVLEGLSNAQIAARRGTSTNTVANQLRSIYAKVGVSSRLALVRLCSSRGPTKARGARRRRAGGTH